jgi:16S rRNA processing protein RimM
LRFAFGRVAGFRGNRGELTVRVASGKAERWVGLTKVFVGSSDGTEERPEAEYEVEEARAYRDRLVLKLRGVEDAASAGALKGRDVAAPQDEVPSLGAGVYYQQELIGLAVEDESGRSVGVVGDVIDTGGAALLEVRRESGGRILVPMAASIVLDVALAERRIRVRLPDGLADLEER